MTRAQRLAELLDRLVDAGTLDVVESAGHFGVSAATIRRDLDHLAAQQLLTRTHGGAVPSSTSYDLPLRYKSVHHADARDRIAQAAAAMLWPECVVALNGGTTTSAIARAIPGVDALRAGLTVVTNAVNIAAELTVRPYIKIVVCGGVARPQSYELVGPLAAATLDRLTADICFLGATGLEPDAGVTTADEGEAAINQVMVQRARRTVVVLDASKLGRVGFARICPVDAVDAVLTDSSADPAALDALRERGVQVITA